MDKQTDVQMVVTMVGQLDESMVERLVQSSVAQLVAMKGTYLAV